MRHKEGGIVPIKISEKQMRLGGGAEAEDSAVGVGRRCCVRLACCGGDCWILDWWGGRGGGGGTAGAAAAAGKGLLNRRSVEKVNLTL